MTEFMRIVQNEWIKLVRRRRFLVALLLGLALIAFYTYTEYHNYERSLRYNDPAFQKERMQEQITTLEKMKSDAGITDERRKQLNENISSLKESISRIDEQKTNNGKPVFDEERARQNVETLKSRLAAAAGADPKEREQLELQVKLAEYRLDHRVPAEGYNYSTSWMSIKQFLDVGSQIFIPLLCVLLVADMVSGEQTGGTIKLLLTRPPTRGKILFAKYVTSIVGSIVIVAILLAALCGALFAAIGTAGGDFPTTVGLKYSMVDQVSGEGFGTTLQPDASHASVLSMSRYIGLSLLLVLAATVAMSTLGFFCSMLVRSAAVSTGIALAVIIIGNIVVHAAHGVTALKYFITPHFDLPLAWSGELSQQFAYPVSLAQSLGILAVWTVVMYAIGHVLFKKRDILG